jgi:hypothetical protein
MGPLFLQGRALEPPMIELFLQIDKLKGNGEEIQSSFTQEVM